MTVPARALSFWISEYFADADLARTSKTTYATWLRKFTTFLTSNLHIQSPTIDDLTESNLREYLRWTKARKAQQRSLFHRGDALPLHLDNNTIRSAFYPLTALCSYLANERRILPQNPMAAIKLPPRKYSAGLRASARDSDVMLLLGAIDKNPDPAKRALELAVVWTLTDSCMRIGALVNATLSGLDLERQEIRVVDKGDKTCTYLFTAACADAVRVWLDYRPTDCTHDYLFCRNKVSKIADEGIRDMIKRYCAQLGLNPKTMLPHSMRHGAAHRLQLSNTPLACIQLRLQHQRIETTLRYLQAGKTKEDLNASKAVSLANTIQRAATTAAVRTAASFHPYAPAGEGGRRVVSRSLAKDAEHHAKYMQRRRGELP
ncbi:MAG: tyrosine-type recombinase/integrase [Capsulimonadaceae bacterium]|nr:tyrosine-type recombinase/integrase [Capsulimonadaceae bacterium]